MKNNTFYAIKTPEGVINWVTSSEFATWNAFFSQNPHRLPVYDAKRAYEAIGYHCIKLSVVESEVVTDDQREVDDNEY